jgi:protein-S-isoprenylcysteine O-methyltransferase Ste14
MCRLSCRPVTSRPFGRSAHVGAMSDLLHSLVAPVLALPSHGLGAMLVLLLYAIQAELRFGSKARSYAAGASDRGSTIALSLSSVVPVVGFVLAMKGRLPANLPGMPTIEWAGVGLGALGLLLRLWSVLTLRERYTRTLLLHEGHSIERGGPYRFVRHPGYLGSLLCLNGIALASGNTLTLLASIPATIAAYSYRIRVEDAMLIASFGAPYERYRLETGALLPRFRAHGKSV